MSNKMFRRGCLVVAVVACAGLVSGPGLSFRPATADAAGLAACTAAAIRLSVTGLGAAAGNSYYSIHLTSMSGRDCVLKGYPRVSFVSAPGGHRLGVAAGHDPAYPARRVILRPGGEAHARLQVGTSGDYPAPVCHPVTVRWLRVYLPATAVPLYTGFDGSTCAGASAHILSISRVQRGGGNYRSIPAAPSLAASTASTSAAVTGSLSRIPSLRRGRDVNAGWRMPFAVPSGCAAGPRRWRRC